MIKFNSNNDYYEKVSELCDEILELLSDADIHHSLTSHHQLIYNILADYKEHTQKSIVNLKNAKNGKTKKVL